MLRCSYRAFWWPSLHFSQFLSIFALLRYFTDSLHNFRNYEKKLRANFSLKLSKQKSVTIFLNVGSKGFLLFRTLTIKAILCYTRKTPVREFSVSLLFSKHFRDFRTVVSTHQPCNEARCAVADTLTPPIPLFAGAILFLRF